MSHEPHVVGGSCMCAVLWSLHQILLEVTATTWLLRLLCGLPNRLLCELALGQVHSAPIRHSIHAVKRAPLPPGMHSVWASKQGRQAKFALREATDTVLVMMMLRGVTEAPGKASK